MQLSLLLTSLTLLASQATMGPKPRQELKLIIDLIERVDKTLLEEHYVSNVQNLYDAGCMDNFFCKVHHILKQNEAFGKSKGEEEIVLNLEVFINGTNVNCPVLLKRTKTSTVKKPIPDALKLLTACIRKKNVKGGFITKPNI